MLCVCATAGINLTAREHFAAALALDMPVFCVVTKADLVAPAALQKMLQAVREMAAAAAATVSSSMDTDGLDSSESGRLHGGSSDGEATTIGRNSQKASAAALCPMPLGAASQGTIFECDEQQEHQHLWQQQVWPGMTTSQSALARPR